MNNFSLKQNDKHIKINVYFFLFQFINCLCTSKLYHDHRPKKKSTLDKNSSNNNNNKQNFFYIIWTKYTAERTNYVRTLNQVALWQNQKQETHSTLSSQALVAASTRCLCFTVAPWRYCNQTIRLLMHVRVWVYVYLCILLLYTQHVWYGCMCVACVRTYVRSNV